MMIPKVQHMGYGFSTRRGAKGCYVLRFQHRRWRYVSFFSYFVVKKGFTRSCTL